MSISFLLIRFMSGDSPSENETRFIDDLARALLKTLGAINSDSSSNFKSKMQDFEDRNKSPPEE